LLWSGIKTSLLIRIGITKFGYNEII